MLLFFGKPGIKNFPPKIKKQLPVNHKHRNYVIFKTRLAQIQEEHVALIARKNQPVWPGNGIYDRYTIPVLTAAHAPIFWEYDLNPETNPFLMKRFGINATFNAGAIKLNGKYLVVARVEGSDRKSFFAVAESPNGIDHFKFWDYPVAHAGNRRAGRKCLRYAS